jgi:hypothetical protein
MKQMQSSGRKTMLKQLPKRRPCSLPFSISRLSAPPTTMETNRSISGVYACHFADPLKKHLLRLKVFFKVAAARNKLQITWQRRRGDWSRRHWRSARQAEGGFSNTGLAR